MNVQWYIEPMYHWIIESMFIQWNISWTRESSLAPPPPSMSILQTLDIKFLRVFAKMTGKGGGISNFCWTRGGTRVSNAKFQVSRSIPSYRYFLQKWGGRGGPYYPFGQKSRDWPRDLKFGMWHHSTFPSSGKIRNPLHPHHFCKKLQKKFIKIFGQKESR